MNDDNPDITAILEYYGGTVPTRRASWAKMKCPFHNDSHASAAVHLGDNLFKCHGCQYKGNGYSIIKEKEGVSFREAVTLAKGILEKSGSPIPQRSTRGRGLPRRTGNYLGASASGSLGRRARAVNGS